ncbi:hypothetical protein ACFOD9_07215 [Novosphingobium bradum]|uniref:Lipoprotein n=1 Tax=Novosphingobium bradum TaxID=1737444 RepID=A0ABV7IMW5_9SPHN
MNSDRKTCLGLAVLALLGGCQEDLASTGKPVAGFGEANRQTMMAQVIDPEPAYDSPVPPTSAQHAAQAAARHDADRIKQPERVRSTESPSSSSSGR